MKFEPINAEEATIEDLENIERSTKVDYADTRPVDLCRSALEMRSILWRFTGDNGESGIIVTQGIRRNGGTELFVQQLGGKGMLKHVEFIFSELEKFAKTQGFRWIAGCSRHGLARVLTSRVGFKAQSVFTIKEIRA